MTTKKEILAIALFVGDSPSELADKLRTLAYEIETQGAPSEYSDGQDRSMVRTAEHAGEIPLYGRYFGVGYDGEGIDPPRALFAYESDAQAFANGGTWDDDDKPSSNGIVTRCDVVMTMWNSFDPDPVKNK